MRKLPSTIFLAVVTLAVVAAAVLLPQRSSHSIRGSGELLFPDLLPRLQDVTRIRVHNSSGAFELARTEQQWLVATQDNYTADQDRIHRLLIGIAGLVRIEPLTRKAERYSQLGLQAPAASGGSALKFELLDNAQQHVAALLVGNRRHTTGGERLYVRVGDDPQAWLVEGKLPDNRDMIDWLSRDIIALQRDRIRDVRIQHASGEHLFVFRLDPFSEDYMLEGLPANKTLKGQWHVNDIGRFLEELRFISVQPHSSAAAVAAETRLTITTFDGLRVRVGITKHAEKLLARLSALADPTLHQKLTPPAAADTSADGSHQQALAAQRSFAEVEAETAALNRLWGKWLYGLPEYKFDYINKTLSDLTEDKAAPIPP